MSCGRCLSPRIDESPPLPPANGKILRLIAQGRRMKEIAADLKISVRTVEDHKSQLLHVLGVQSTADLIRYAVKQGLISD